MADMRRAFSRARISGSGGSSGSSRSGRALRRGSMYLLSGRIRVRLELEGGDREAEVRPGQALAIPRGTWHQIIVDEPGQLVNVTPGPGGQSRPLPGA